MLETYIRTVMSKAINRFFDLGFEIKASAYRG